MSKKRPRRWWTGFGQSSAPRPTGRLLDNSPFKFRLLRGEWLEDRSMLAGGGLDPQFGTNGESIIPVSTRDDFATTMKVDSQGRIVMAGSTLQPGGVVSPSTNTDWAIVRLLPNGSLDPSFGNGGIVIQPVGLSVDQVGGLDFQNNGDIIVSGYYWVSGDDLIVDPVTDNIVTSLRREFVAEDVGTTLHITSPAPWFVGDYKITSVNAGAATLDASPAPVGSTSGNWYADNYDFATARFNEADGSLDTSFGLNGFSLTPIAPLPLLGQPDVPVLNSYATSVVVDSLDRIVVAGYAEVPRGTTALDRDFAVIRYDDDGVIDTSFFNGTAAQGKVITPIGPNSNNDFGYSVDVNGTNQIIVAGSTSGANNSNFAFVKYTVNGLLDTTFDSDGIQTVDFGTGGQIRNDFANSVRFLSNGRIIASGTSNSTTGTNPPADVALAQLTSNGVLDTTFNQTGRVLSAFSSLRDLGNSLDVDTGTGQIYVGGTSTTGTNSDVFVARYTSAGALDTTWGTNGRVTTAVGTRNDFGSTIDLTPAGVVLAGSTDVNTSGTSTNFDFFALRYLLTGSPSPPPPPPPPPVSGLAIDDVTITEGDAGIRNAVFTVTLSPANAAQVTVQFATADVSATNPGDYQTTAGTLTFAPGSTSQNITVAIVGDTANEPTETFQVNLSNPTAGVTISDGQGIGTINDNDSAVRLLTINDVTLNEGNSGTSLAVFTVDLSGSGTQTVRVRFATANGTATAGSDYVARTGTLTFAPGVPSRTITIAVNGNTAFEPDETFFVNLSNVTGGATISDGQGVGTITNDDGATTAISISDLTITEGNSGTSSAVFTATLSNSLGANVTVVYGTANGSAAAGTDYVAQNGTLTFAPGITSRNITIGIVGDTVSESTEGFIINLSNPSSNATLAKSQGAGTIIDNDASGVFYVNDVIIQEAASGAVNAVFTVAMSSPIAGTATVRFNTTNGTATAPADYGARTGTLTFTPNVTSRMVTVAIVNDGVAEGDETFFLQLTNPVNATIADGTGLATIQDPQPGGGNPDFIVDDGGPGYSQIGTWSNGTNTNAFQLDFRTAARGTGSSQATWTFSNLTPGQYQVYTRWIPFTNRATNAPYTILDNNVSKGTVSVNQRLTPDDDNTNGVNWESLGTVTITSTTLRVRLTNAANGFVTADAVRIVQLNPFSAMSSALAMMPASSEATVPSTTSSALQATVVQAAASSTPVSLASYLAALRSNDTSTVAARLASVMGPRQTTASSDAAFGSDRFLEDLL